VPWLSVLCYRLCALKQYFALIALHDDEVLALS
jgi:hypothetical protein